MFKCLTGRARAFTVSAQRLNFFFFFNPSRVPRCCLSTRKNGCRTGCFFKTGLEQTTILLSSAPQVLQFLEYLLEELGCLPAELQWLRALSLTRECTHRPGVLCGRSQLWQHRGKLEASRVKEVTYSFPPFLEDRAQTHTPGGRAYCLLPQGCFPLCRWLPSWNLWEASASVRSSDRKGHICAAEAGSEVLVWRQALSICFKRDR